MQSLHPIGACFFAAAGFVALARATPVAAAEFTADWYRVTPAAEATATARMHDWRGLAGMPESGSAPVEGVRQALESERLARMIGLLDMRRPEDVSLRRWPAGETVSFDDPARDRDEGGLFGGWLSDFVARQEDPLRFASRGDGDFGGMFGRESRERSWGWLADEVQRRERAIELRETLESGDRRSAGDSGVFGGLDPTPGLNPAGVGRTHAWDPDWRRARDRFP